MAASLKAGDESAVASYPARPIVNGRPAWLLHHDQAGQILPRVPARLNPKRSRQMSASSIIPALALVAMLPFAAPAFGQSAETPYVNGSAVTQSNPLPVVETQPPPAAPSFTMPAPPQLSRWRLDCLCFKANP
jgi:hypothetical protein